MCQVLDEERCVSKAFFCTIHVFDPSVKVKDFDLLWGVVGWCDGPGLVGWLFLV